MNNVCVCCVLVVLVLILVGLWFNLAKKTNNVWICMNILFLLDFFFCLFKLQTPNSNSNSNSNSNANSNQKNPLSLSLTHTQSIHTTCSYSIHCYPFVLLLLLLLFDSNNIFNTFFIMSSPASSTNNQNTPFECPVCFKRFTATPPQQQPQQQADKTPRVLLCGHSICTACLQGLIDQQSNKNNKRITMNRIRTSCVYALSVC